MATSLLSRLTLPSLTTTQRDALTDAANGQFIHNATTGTIQARQNNTWKDLPLDIVELSSLGPATGTLDTDDGIVSVEDGNAVLATVAQLHRLLQFTDTVAGFDTGNSAVDLRINGGDGLLGSLILRGSTNALPGPVRMANLMIGVDPTITPDASMSAYTAMSGTDVFDIRCAQSAGADLKLRDKPAGVLTTDATVTSAATITTAADTVYPVQARVWARQTAGTGTVGHAAYYVRHGLFSRTGGTVRLVGAVATPVSIEDNAGWDATLDFSGTAIRCRVTGEASKTIRWHSVLTYGVLST
jgi:hypothetical protein